MPGHRLNWVVADIVKRTNVWDIEEGRDDTPEAPE
jgi:hypothetical protein